jgi:hypothetical protein
MNHSQRINIIGLLLVFLLVSWVDKQSVSEIKNTNPIVETKENSRESITFILGEDREKNNLYYEEASKFYKKNPINRSEYLVTTCASLLEASEYLISNPPANGLPWGSVNLVTHGNQWLGLSVKIQPGGMRTTVKSLQSAIINKILTPLPDNIIDCKSEILLHGCGIGKNEELVNLMGKAFSSNAQKPIIRASKLFESYISVINSDNEYTSEKYLAKAWFAYYKKGYRPGDIRLSKQLRQKYPDAPINWRDVLLRKEPRWPGDSYSYTFHVPIKWIVIYPDAESPPDISSEENKQFWLIDQDKLISTIEKTQIPFNRFSWHIKNIKYQLEDGNLIPAIRAKGYTTVLCIIVPETSAEPNFLSKNRPLVPDLYDTSYYYVEKGSKY